jgi:pilus assembly protein CpaB
MIRRNILLVIGLLALLTGSGLSFLWLAQQRAPAENSEQRAAQISVLAASHSVAAGMLLRPDDMVWTAIPAATETPGYIARGVANETDFVGAFARRAFQANEPFTVDALVKKTERSFLSAVLAPGNRAVTIPADASQTASGLASPGDRVDIVLTQNFGDRKVAAVVLQNVRIVAVDQSLGQTSPTATTDRSYAQTPQMPRTVTLELTEHDAEKLLVATQLGKIDLAVRAIESEQPAAKDTPAPVWADEVSPATKLPAAHPVAADETPRTATPIPNQPSSIEVMHGAKIEMR